MSNCLKKNLILYISFAIILMHSLYFYQQKKGFFLDEALSFRLANSNVVTIDDVAYFVSNESIEQLLDELLDRTLEIYKWQNQDEILAKYTTIHGEEFNYINVYFLQAMDNHPPLYYFVLKTLCSIFQNVDLISIGFLINIICLLLVCYIVYRIGIYVFDNQICAIAAMLYYGLSFSFINNATFFRMYALLTFLTILLLFLCIRWMKNGYDSDKKSLICLCLVEYAAMMTQYFAFFICVPLFVMNIIFMVIDKKSIKSYLIFNIVTVVMYLFTWPFAIRHLLFTDRGDDVTENLREFRIIQNIMEYKDTVSQDLFANINLYIKCFFILLCATVLSKIVKAIINRNIADSVQSDMVRSMLYVFITAFAYFVIASNSVPWFVDRYIMPVMPLFSIIIVYVIYQTLLLIIKNKTICGCFLILFAMIICIFWHARLVPHYLFNDSDRKSYVENYTELDAVIIDKPDEILNSEIELNFSHPNIYETDYDNASQLREVLSKDNKYVAYIRNTENTDDLIIQLEEMGYDLRKIEYESEFYKIYLLSD